MGKLHQILAVYLRSLAVPARVGKPEDALRILKKDLAKIKRYKCNKFVRRPYYDLSEIEMLKAYPNAPENIEAVIVISVIKGDTNARIPISRQQIVDALQQDYLDLYTKPESQGFA
jgi:hypothetical protein